MYLVSYGIFDNAKSHNWVHCYQKRTYIVQITFYIEGKYIKNIPLELSKQLFSMIFLISKVASSPRII